MPQGIRCARSDPGTDLYAPKTATLTNSPMPMASKVLAINSS
jgi:hypothetical protein